MNTEPTFFRRLTSPFRRLLWAMSAVCLFNAGSPALADAVTLPDMLIGVTQGFLEFTVEDYLATSQTEGRYEIQVNQLDPRLRMPMCDKELTASLESPAKPLGRVTVKVRCEGTSPWTVFVPAQVRLFRDVVTTTRPLRRADIVEPADVLLRERDISLINQGYLTTLEQAIGQRLTRPMVADQVITLVHLEQAEVIRKGDQVVITAHSGTLSVRMPGEALSNGGMSEQIRVKNLNSKRVIKAQVTAPGQVEVSM
ncbi:flagellar basal body P-ring formation protein FlgA [Pseudomonas hormoni]|uniref:Flagella basal body P-ring formation protein FlgA n=1 Tax=Pseudomonas hormoni TaxID=3093767 RepID=A0ABX8EQR7_9PSED|nr:flagellar basal body P-ring formation chaperone FlgA [Pseudomonas hormoni]QVW22029.1 flagellar basal body P-ring formation protein FlgA [Pseudomonas hormoni]